MSETRRLRKKLKAVRKTVFPNKVVLVDPDDPNKTVVMSVLNGVFNIDLVTHTAGTTEVKNINQQEF